MNVIIGNKQQGVLDTLGIDVIKSLNGEFEVDELIDMFKNFFYQRMILDITAVKNYQDLKNLQTLSIGLDMDKLVLVLDIDGSVESSAYLSKLISMGIYNFTRNRDGIIYLFNNPNSYRDVAQYHQLESTSNGADYSGSGCRIIGIKNLTQQSGATTLTYLMCKALSSSYDVVAVEVDGNDASYFANKNFNSITSAQLPNFLSTESKRDVILVDMCRSKIADEIVTDVIYLVEPSLLKLNKAMYLNKRIFKNVEDQNIILNQSLLSNKEVLELEYEAKTKFTFNMPPLNERESDIPILNSYLSKLGFAKMGDSSSEEYGEGKKKWGIF